MEEKKLNEEEGLRIIRQMIQVAKDDHRENGDGWLIWGWLLFAASILSIIFMQTGRTGWISWTWMIMLGVGLLVYLFFHIRKRNAVKTYLQDLLDKSGTGFFISLFSIITAGMISGVGAGFDFGYYYILYAFWMYIHGSAIRFKPLLVGAYVNWIAAIGIFLVDDFTYDMIISAIAILAGYLVPGYLLRAEYKRQYLKEEKL